MGITLKEAESSDSRAASRDACSDEKQIADHKPISSSTSIELSLNGHSDGNTRLSFLDLPGELRNYIYEHVVACPTDVKAEVCSADMANRTSPICRIKEPQFRHPMVVFSLNEDDEPVVETARNYHRRSQYLHLMHVCRQIRAEFRVMYLRHPIRVDYSSATNYVETFYPTQPVFRADTERLTGDIQIDVDKISNTNIVSLLQHLYRLPKLRFEFGYQLPSMDDPASVQRSLFGRLNSTGLNELFRGHADAWKKHLGANIGRLSFFTWHTSGATRDAHHLEVHFKPHTPGMNGYGTNLPGSGHGSLSPILKDLGLSDMKWMTVQIRRFLGS